MARIASIALVILVLLSSAAGATRISTVGAGSGDSASQGLFDRHSWMPEIAANTVFRKAPPGMHLRSLEAAARLDATPLALRVTTLWRGDPQLVFADQVYAHSKGSFAASFIASTP